MAPALEELTVQWGDSCGGQICSCCCSEGGQHAGLRELGEVTHPVAGTREGFRRRCCLDGDVRAEQELAREGKQEGKGKYVYVV